MAYLLNKKENVKVFDKVTQLQNINENNSTLEYTGLRVLEFEAGGKLKESLSEWEVCVVALSGKITVTEDDNKFKNIGTRDSVFERIPTDSVYISNNRSYEVEADTESTVILAYAPSTEQKETKLITASDNTIERRGKYSNKRLVHNILPDDSPIANSLLVVEVYTDSGNWSSYPPHKHDEDNLPHESFLEEIYYHEMDPKQGFVFQRVYTEDRSIDEVMAVYNQDAVLVPAGYHPVSVPDGYDSYYLNVMAGPTRKWEFHNEVDHEWILERD